MKLPSFIRLHTVKFAMTHHFMPSTARRLPLIVAHAAASAVGAQLGGEKGMRETG